MSKSPIGRLLPAPSRAERTIAGGSKGHCTAWVVLGDGPGTRMQAESHLELVHLYLLSARREIACLHEQVRFRYGARNDREHVFDVVATLKANSKIAFTVKPEAGLTSGNFLQAMQIVAWWVRESKFANEVRLLTDADVDRTDLYNAKLLAGVLGGDAEAELKVRNVAAGLTGAASVGEIARAVGLRERGYRAVLLLIRLGVMGTCKHEHITSETLVYWKGKNR